jgi:hypothetical protein
LKTVLPIRKPSELHIAGSPISLSRTIDNYLLSSSGNSGDGIFLPLFHQ